MSAYRNPDGSAINLNPYRLGYLQSAIEHAIDAHPRLAKQLREALAHTNLSDEELAAHLERRDLEIRGRNR